jgi:hypothetical protein
MLNHPQSVSSDNAWIQILGKGCKPTSHTTDTVDHSACNIREDFGFLGKSQHLRMAIDSV